MRHSEEFRDGTATNRIVLTLVEAVAGSASRRRGTRPAAPEPVRDWTRSPRQYSTRLESGNSNRFMYHQTHLGFQSLVDGSNKLEAAAQLDPSLYHPSGYWKWALSDRVTVRAMSYFQSMIRSSGPANQELR
ncbi:uncharacterized protein PGTG_01876 [Puccinia graminis f. sp. tritici CRL 75-36-700-3]|uniref:Uncharacterized protein n=1 Tax=Puccinia graminis f. sp. tritici (strain CRL 75-36-700-3 / race SCCL) TaxID=418459 RepID=E3JT56_PUCGT|nr:uncharacterized protein PGTG_01876 [Puccinia graminis f. sp. tritici CRL 75-36-700-3]EFP75283.1 hypothetical protein PGTG_01876 [Puccinia graminis f. sp. tritici CRL 75-36-700-3]